MWFGNAKPRALSRLLIDIGPASVAGAYAYFPTDGEPVLCYGIRAPITPHASEVPEAAMERALEVLCDALETEGVAALARVAGGNGRASEVLVSIDAPWQQTLAHREELRKERPFTFTKHMLTEILTRSRAAFTEDPERSVEQHVVSIRLNGYETAHPFGQSARRAALVVLMSWMQIRVLEATTALLRKRFHHTHPRFVSGPTLRYRALMSAFPHEEDLLILDAASYAAALSLVRSRALVAVEEFPSGNDEKAWVAAVVGTLRELAGSYPLPHTILLVANGPDAPAHASALEEGGLGALWLSDNPPKVVPVSKVSSTQVRLASGALPDIRLALMAHYTTLPLLDD